MKTFSETLEAHLEAIRGRDLEALLKTVNTTQSLTVVMPNGHLVSGRSAFEKTHQEWFADPDWSLSFETVKTEASESMAYALLLVDYKDKNPQGQLYEKKYYLTLVFIRDGGHWLLTHDQNTFL